MLLNGRDFITIGQAIVPTVTNVNNTSILTASFPDVHGITSNYFVDYVNGEEYYMESPEFLLVETVFRRMLRKVRNRPFLLLRTSSRL